MVGKPWTPDVRELVKQEGIAGRVHEWVEASNEELRAIYSTAVALIFPSFQEGFGWPIAEAQACGCPVFATNRAPMTEVGGDAAAYFDPDDADGATRVVAEGIGDANCMSRRGLENAERFSSGAMLAAYSAALEQVVTEHRSASGPR